MEKGTTSIVPEQADSKLEPMSASRDLCNTEDIDTPI